MRGTAFLALVGLASAGVLPRQQTSSAPVQRPTTSPVPEKDTQAGPASTCSSPLIRKEWRGLSSAEQQDYISAVKCLQTTDATAGYDIPAVKSMLDDYTYTHNALADDIHFVAGFLPWHRWILSQHERLLRDVCGYQGAQPYWDWTIDAEAGNVATSPIWDATTGFGGNGKVEGGNGSPGYVNCVADGPFANLTITLGMGYPNQEVAGSQPHCLNRRFNSGRNDLMGRPIVGDMRAGTYNLATMKAAYRLDKFADFASTLERIPHSQVHNAIGGDMSPTTAPNDPIFYLHHANVDRAWAKWQGRNATRLADFSGNKDQRNTMAASPSDTMPIMALGDDPVVSDYLDTMAGPLCYQYTDST